MNYLDQGSAATIRPEMASDFAQVAAVVEEAFSKSPLGYHGEADLVEALRSSCSGLVSLVAQCEERVVGHVLFSPVTIEIGSSIVRGMGLAPLAVLPEFQRRGIGTLLVREGVALLRERGDEFMCVFGYPAFYGRFGFDDAARLGIECEFGGGDGTFQIAWLRDPPQLYERALLRYHPEFSRAAHQQK